MNLNCATIPEVEFKYLSYATGLVRLHNRFTYMCHTGKLLAVKALGLGEPYLHLVYWLIVYFN